MACGLLILVYVGDYSWVSEWHTNVNINLIGFQFCGHLFIKSKFHNPFSYNLRSTFIPSCTHPTCIKMHASSVNCVASTCLTQALSKDNHSQGLQQSTSYIPASFCDLTTRYKLREVINGKKTINVRLHGNAEMIQEKYPTLSDHSCTQPAPMESFKSQTSLVHTLQVHLQ